jgi:hypothetical protein
MRKLFRISAMTAVALGTIAFSAEAQRAKEVGILAGVASNSISGDDFDGTASRTGFRGGVYLTVPVGTSMAIEPEVLYAQKGINDENSDLHLNNGYIEVPVLFRYNFNPEGGPYILAGPAIGFSISCDLSDGDDSISCDDFGAEPETAFSGVVGLGFQKKRFGLEARYDFDFGDSYKNSAGKNAAFEFLARIMIK